MSGLGRRVPTDWKHAERWPLTAATAPSKAVPVAIGVNWYEAFDHPQWDGKAWWIGRGDLGNVRGGHCVCLQPHGVKDNRTWYLKYDQGREGACVGYGSSRMMSLLNRRFYDARWLWHAARLNDEWPDNDNLSDDDQGTSVRAAMDVLRTQGHVVVRNGKDRPVSLSEGISANRWATSVDDVLAALGTPGREYVVVLNSWGGSYPRAVRLPAETLERLRQEDGELAVVTDR